MTFVLAAFDIDMRSMRGDAVRVDGGERELRAGTIRHGDFS